MGGRGLYLLFFERIHFLRPVDLDVGDEGEGIAEVEVFACWGGGGLCHGKMRDWVIMERWGGC